jgi:hypothetical protein
VEGKDRQYLPEFIVRANTPLGKTINLILEISGFNRDKDYKRSYVYNRWLPAVNNIQKKYKMDEWHFMEVMLISGTLRMK